MHKSVVLSLSLLALLASGPALAKGASSTPLGRDVSYPQCTGHLQAGQAFGIVGLNGGIANKFNTCFAKEFAWANGSTGATSQPKAQLYVNTGNPGAVVAKYGVTDWPSSNVVEGSTITTNDAYGPCTPQPGDLNYPFGPDNQACAWQYGYNKGYLDYQYLVGTNLAIAPQSLNWWLDVEDTNSWDPGTTGQQNNVATLEGMVAALSNAGIARAHMGLYSSPSMWTELFGTQPGGTADAPKSLTALPNWQAGASSLSGAITNCSNSPFYGTGPVMLTQYTANGEDFDYSCIK